MNDYNLVNVYYLASIFPGITLLFLVIYSIFSSYIVNMKSIQNQVFTGTLRVDYGYIMGTETRDVPVINP